MKSISKIIGGILLLGLAVVLLLNAFDVTDFDIWFDGWWTLFIIIPCGVGLFTEKDKFGNLFGLAIGVSLLLAAQGVIDYDILWKLILPVIIIIIALKLIIGGIGKKKNKIVEVSVEAPSGTAIFGGKEMNFDGQKFEGCELCAVFGGVDCDLRGAIIEHDCKINAIAVFGGVDILLPKGVNAQVSSTNIFGGTEDQSEKTPDSPVTVYIDAVSVFGGVDVK